MKKTILALAVMTFITGTTTASAYIVNEVEGPLQNTTGILSYATGASMADATVTVTYGDDTIRTYDWTALGGNAGGVDLLIGDSTSTVSVGTFGMSGSSWTTNWDLDVTNSSFTIANIFIDAGEGDAVFDIISSPDNSAGSSTGKAFWITSSSYDDITATYSGAVGIAGAAPLGDLYRYLNINFTGNSFGINDTLSFRADTDMIKGNINPVPEPSTVILMGLGLASLVGYNRKRNGKKS